MQTRRTTVAKKGEVKRSWWVVDATDQVLGRLAARIAEQLRIVTARRAGFEQGVMAFRPGWSPSPVRRVEFGFDAKRIVLIHTICSLAGFDDGANLEGHREIFEAVMAPKNRAKRGYATFAHRNSVRCTSLAQHIAPE